jgi:hypothetical protein
MHRIPLNILGFFQTYHFFVLALFMGVPAWWLVFRHPQYRKETECIAALVTPFALTERFFVPEYWNPVFLGPFFQWAGAGVEDLLFVVHLAWMTVYSPLVMFRRDWGKRSTPWNRRVLARIAGLVAATFGSFGVAIRLGLNPLIAAAVGMLFGMLFMVCTTPQILRDVGRGLLAGGTAYSLVCLVYGAVYPEDFKTIWRTGGLSNQFVLGVPLEEVVYGVLAGGLGGSFIPFLQGVPTRPQCLGNISKSLGKNSEH